MEGSSPPPAGGASEASRMNVRVAHSKVTPNTQVMNSQGIWLAYIVLVGPSHVLLSIPFYRIPGIWTLTNVIHNLAMYVIFYTVKGTPFETPDQGKAWLLTHWNKWTIGSNLPLPANSSAFLPLYSSSWPASTPSMMLLTSSSTQPHCSAYCCLSYPNSMGFMSLASTNTEGWGWG